jgi:SAM-dependent methyltransferase/uncharacterized protein YbaR (Trm112 family)
MMIDAELLEMVRCPVSGQRLSPESGYLVTEDLTRRYPIVCGIPCLMPSSAEPTHNGYTTLVRENAADLASGAAPSEQEVADFINAMLIATCGNLFRGVRLDGLYPIPDFPEVFDRGVVLDVGSNWGRWSVGGAMRGYRMVGVDIHLKSLLAAQALSRKLLQANRPGFVLADARHMPFDSATFDGVFSYSVVQHFSKQNAAVVLREIQRVLRPGARSFVQMPNRAGARSALTLARRGFTEGREFDVRYYSIAELLSLFGSTIGPSQWSVDCFLGLNVHSRDRQLLPRSKKWIVDLASALLTMSRRFPVLGRFSDSVFINSVKRA